jgi:hypothetical protein
MWFLLRGIPCTIPICCFCCPHGQAWAIAWCVVLHSLWAVKMAWPCVRRCKECSKNRELYVISLRLLLIYIYFIDIFLGTLNDFGWNILTHSCIIFIITAWYAVQSLWLAIYIYIYIYIYVYNNIRSSTIPTQYANMEHITLQILHCQYVWFMCFYYILYIYTICIILYHIYGWFIFHIIYIHDTISCLFISHKPW